VEVHRSLKGTTALTSAGTEAQPQVCCAFDAVKNKIGRAEGLEIGPAESSQRADSEKVLAIT
jgi:hypothetical protein